MARRRAELASSSGGLWATSPGWPHSLKDAFAQGRLTRDEFGARAGRALDARTGAELAALTADIPAGTGPARPPAPARHQPPAPVRRRRPLVRAAAGAGGCGVIAFAAMRFFEAAEPGGPYPAPYHSFAFPSLFVAIAAVVAALFILGYGVGAAIEHRRSRRQLPPRPRPTPGTI
jgi:hypothetical protein